MASLAASLRSPGEEIPAVEDGFALPLKVAGLSGAAWGLVVWVQATGFGLLNLVHLPLLAVSGAALGLVGPAVAAATVHPLVYFFGGERYELTYKVFGLYAPVGALGAVLGLNLLVFPALFALEVRGLRSVHGLSWWGSVAAMSAPALVLSLVGGAVGLAAVGAGVVAMPGLPV
jgi:hypothetical protein